MAAACVIAELLVVRRRRRQPARQLGAGTAGATAIVAVVVLLAHAVIADAGDIKVFTTRAIATVLRELGPDVERATGHQVIIVSDIAIRMVRRIEAGESFDVLVAAPGHIDDLIQQGTIMADTRTDLARSGIGVEVRAGAHKQALLDAKSIAYLKEGQSGLYLAGMIERLGIADAIRPKVTRPETDIVSELVAKGDIELGMVVITQIITTPGVELAGPLPPELQSYVTFTAGVSTSSTVPSAAKQLISLLTGPSAIRVMKLQGMEPR